MDVRRPTTSMPSNRQKLFINPLSGHLLCFVQKNPVQKPSSKCFRFKKIIMQVLFTLLGFQSLSQTVKVCTAVQTRTLSSRVVTTKYGSVRGMIVTLPNRSLQPVEIFLGIPYASPPTGKLRFMPPVTPASWSGIRTSEIPGPVCPQNLPNISNQTEALLKMTESRYNLLKQIHSRTVNQSEDCLYLNIYAPAAFLTQQSTYKLSVMMFIHGESYEWNSGSNYDGSVLASFGNVLVVTINFRLGVLGFFATPNGPSRGNYGLMDQVAALHWIQENIGAFGGDPSNVTIFGHGYGAVFVNLLMLSPMSKGLFRKAIMQSGSALSPWAIATDGVKYSRLLAQSVGCLIEDISGGNNRLSETNVDRNLKRKEKSAAITDCLRHKPVQDLVSFKVKVPTYLTAFGPTLDGLVVPNELLSLMTDTSSLFGTYDLLFGVTKFESSGYFTTNDERNGIDQPRRDRILKTLVRNIFSHHLHEIFLTIINEYTDWSRSTMHPFSILDSLVDILNDVLYVAPTIKAGLAHSRVKRKRSSNSPASTYFYNFAQSFEKGDYKVKLSINETSHGHGMDLPFVFGAPLISGTSIGYFKGNYSKQDSTLSEVVINYWTNFAKFGDPNIGAYMSTSMARNKVEKLWSQYEEETQYYLMMSSRPKAKDHFQSHRLSFWHQLIPKLDLADSSVLNRDFLQDFESSENFEGVIRESTIVSQASLSSASNQSSSVQPTSNTSSAPVYETSKMSPSGNVNQDGSQPSSDELSSFMNGSFSMVIQESNYSTALGVTIAIGSFLLILNVAVFVALFYRRDRASNSSDGGKLKKAYAKSVSNEVQQIFRSSEGCVGTTSVEVYSNCDGLCVAEIEGKMNEKVELSSEQCECVCNIHHHHHHSGNMNDPTTFVQAPTQYICSSESCSYQKFKSSPDFESLKASQR